MMQPELVTVAMIEREIGSQAKAWEGNCYSIAHAVLSAGFVDGHLRYGHWLGKVEPGNVFSGRGIVTHGWVELEDKRILDPTRWVFEAAAPYIFLGANGGEYDLGGAAWHKSKVKPPPIHEDGGKQWQMFGQVLEYVNMMLLRQCQFETVSIEELFWLGNLPPDMWPNVYSVWQFYTWCESNDAAAFIPIDFRDQILGGQMFKKGQRVAA